MQVDPLEWAEKFEALEVVVRSSSTWLGPSMVWSASKKDINYTFTVSGIWLISLSYRQSQQGR